MLSIDLRVTRQSNQLTVDRKVIADKAVLRILIQVFPWNYNGFIATAIQNCRHAGHRLIDASDAFNVPLPIIEQTLELTGKIGGEITNVL